jgi:hypothetical protein
MKSVRNYVVRILIFCSILHCILFGAGCCSERFATAGNAGGQGRDGRAVPWTNLMFADEPGDFRFAIVSDRGGGARTGVFETAMADLNLLQPEFVMSVGDLIEGDSQEQSAMDGMWKENTELVSCLQMPFFRIPGNHDLVNAEMDAEWDKLFGSRYYSFTYKGVLFLCLNTQDDKNREGLGAAQIAWARNVIAQNAGVRWTFVFMHYPLWINEEGDTETNRKKYTKKRDTGFRQIENALAGRNYSVFAGHCHQYIQFNRHGHQYYVLASTGADNDLAGVEHGEFDEVVWVTMRPAGPVVANLKLDGILRDDVYNELHLKTAQSLQFKSVPFDSNAPLLSMTAPLAWSNPFPQSVKMELAWSFPTNCPWTVTPLRAGLDIPPLGKVSPAFQAALKQTTTEIFPLPTLHARLAVSNGIAVVKTMLLPFDVTAYLRSHLPEVQCRGLTGIVKVDGKLDDVAWQRPPDVTNMAVVTLDRNPSMPTTFWLTYDASNLYVAVRCGETNLQGLVATTTKRDGNCWLDDSVELFVATDSEHTNYYQFIVTAAGFMYDSKGFDKAWNGGATAAVGREKDAWTLEIAVPWRSLGIACPAPDSRLGLQLARARIQSHEVFQWSPSPEGNHASKLFGYIHFQPLEIAK